MDSQKIAEAFETLKSLFVSKDSGRQWSGGGKAPPKLATGPLIEYSFGGTVWQVLENADELRVLACGLADQPRFGRRHHFTCSGNIATQEFGDKCLGGMKVYGEVVTLNQTLSADWQGLVAKRTLLKLDDHVGRPIRMAYKLEDGIRCQIAHQIKKPYVIERHLVSCIWLDRPPEPHASGYLFAQFD